ncbi:TonB-dependent receptor [Echinicola sediminis]
MKKNRYNLRKLLMRFSALCILLLIGFQGVLARGASAQSLESTSILLHKGSYSIGDILKDIEDQTGFHFTYYEEDLDLEGEFTVDRDYGSLYDLLYDLSLKKQVRLSRIGSSISISKIVLETETAGVQEQIHVKGKVLDEIGVPLPGALIIQQGENGGTTTDLEGNFEINVQSDAILLVSYIGYKTQIVAVEGRTSLEIRLQLDNHQMEEVVVIGYGTASKDKISGAVASMDAEDIQEYPNANIDQAMVGKLAGVNILTNARNPGDGNTITIRGAGSITRNANPLIVVDGFPLAEGSSMNVLNPNDIASIDVIKDAASSAIYGSRAANGLIMITTKNGTKSKKPTIKLHSVVGVQERTGTYDLLNAYDAAVFFRDGRNNAYLKNHPNASLDDSEEERIANGANVRELILDYTVPYLNNQPGLTDFDWEDAVYRSGLVQNHHVSISGATDATDYLVSVGFTDEEGIVITADQQRYTTNIKLNTNISKQVKFGLNLNGMYAERGLTNGSNQYRFPVDPAGRAMVYMYPFFSAFDENNPTGYNVEAQIRANRPYNANMQENPVAMAELSKYDRRQFRTFGNTYLSAEPIDHLVLKTSLGFLWDYNFTDQYAPMLMGAYRELISERNPLQGWEQRNENGDILIENTAKYNFGTREHSFEALLGQSFQKSNASSLRVNGYDFPNDIIDNIDGSTRQTGSASRSSWTQLSYFGRLLYNYHDRYFLTGSIRRDGSSRFGPDTRYGTFGSFSAGWVLSKESFFPQNDFLTYSKLRYSWGQTGNNQIGNYSHFAGIGTGKNYPYDGLLSAGAGPISSPSYSLTWETNTSNNFGLDLGFFDRVWLGVDYYIANISDLLLDRPVPNHTGFDSSLQNIGEMQNRGWEFELNGAGFNFGKLDLGFNANLTTNENEVLSLGGVQEIYESGNQRFITRVGESLANLYGYKIVGILKSEEEVQEYLSRKHTTLSAEVGDYIFQDTDGNDIIDADDRVLLGDYKPEVTYGFGLNLVYKAVDFAINFNGTLGRVAIDENTSRYLEYGEAFTNTNYHYFNNYWDPVRNPDGYLAPPDAYGNTVTRIASRNPTNYNVLDADYLRIRSIQVGYNLPEQVLKKLHMKKMRVYAAANNLYTWTNYRGMNPDGGDTGNPLNSGHIQGTTSVPRLVSAGINLTF